MNRILIQYLLLITLSTFSVLAQQANVEETEAAYLETAASNIEMYRKGDATLRFVDRSGEPISGLDVHITQTGHAFLFGNLLFPMSGYEDREPYRYDVLKERFERLFNMAILPFYWQSHEKTGGHPAWQQLEPNIDWALGKGITCKGHPLAWSKSEGTPEWILELPEDLAETLLYARIAGNVAGFKGKIDIWDVVNEPVNMVPWRVALKEKENNNRGRYTSATPIADLADWIEPTYKVAYKANPQGHFVLNEYNTFAIPETRERFGALITELLERGTPVSGIGLQAHEPRQMWYSPEQVWSTLDKYSEFGLPLHITEFTPATSGKEITGGWREGVWTEETQAEFAEQMYRLCFGHPAVVSFNWWGLSDRYSWMPDGGLLDENYRPKPVYHMLDRLINEEWTTPDILTSADTDGMVTFRGFHGTYDVVVTTDEGVVSTFNIDLRNDEKNEREYILSR